MISMKCYFNISKLLSTCWLVQCFRQYFLISQRVVNSFPFAFHFRLLSTNPTTFSASKESAFTFPVTSSRQSTRPFLTESLSSRARLSLTQMWRPLPPEKTNMSCSNPKSSARAFSIISTAVISNFQHLVHTFFPSQQVLTSSQSFISKSNMSSLSIVFALDSFSGVRFQMAPASTFSGTLECLSIILFFIAMESTKVTYLSTPEPSYSKESSRWASWDLLLWVSQRTMVSKGQRQLQQTCKSYSDILEGKYIIIELLLYAQTLKHIQMGNDQVFGNFAKAQMFFIKKSLFMSQRLRKIILA